MTNKVETPVQENFDFEITDTARGKLEEFDTYAAFGRSLGQLELPIPVFEEFAAHGSLAHNPVETEIVSVCVEIMNMLIEKNRSYGNSALEPIGIFSKATNLEQIGTRIDDKLNRVKKGREFPGEDTVDDLIGYLILLKVANRNNWK